MLAGFLAVVALVALTPMRGVAARVASRIILFLAAPIAPNVSDLKSLPQSTEIVAIDGTVLARLDRSERRVAVKLGDLPDHVPHAVLAAEDRGFYGHSGLDPEAILRAVVRTAGGDKQGGSTISQQLAKLNYTAGERTVARKLREVLYTAELESRYSKDELLGRYINQVYFGEGAYGIEAAARVFFGVPAEQLSVGQAAVLAGKIRSPEGLDPRKDPDAVVDRRNRVLAGMADAGWLEPAARTAAEAEPLTLAPPSPPAQALAPHFVEFVKREAGNIGALGRDLEGRKRNLLTRGYRLETTMDAKAFAATASAVQARLGEATDPVTATATVVPGDGAIRSLFGGLDFLSTQFDTATLDARQPGSAFKPFVYLAALRDGIDPRTTFDGTSGRVVGCYGAQPVQNYAGEDAGGQITVDEATVKSVNVVFADLGCATGVRDVVRAGLDAGLPEDATKAQGAVFLGGLDKGVSALSMAGAYASFAAGGTYAKPYGIAKIRNADGDVIYEHKPELRQAFKSAEAGVLTRILIEVVKRGTGTAAGIGRPVAGKTGTTTDNIDAWFAGYTPQLATAVWVGYGDRRAMSNVHGRSVTGGSFPAQVFADVMRKAHQGLPVRRLATATPDDLDLQILTASTTPTSSSSTTSSTTVRGATTVPGVTTTTTRAGRTTTTATATTTTTAKPKATTTTRAATTTTSTSTTTSTTTTSTPPPP